MRIVEEIKLDFSDVLIKPKRSQLKTRKEVELEREFNFKYSNYKWTGVPIIAANMDGVGTLSMYKELSEHKCLTALTKFHNGTFPMSDFYMITLGIDDDEKMTAYTNKDEFCPFKWICLDVANGYTERFVEYVEKIRNKFSNHIIVAGNVVTAEMTEQLILAGADVVKVGIGPGCFAPGQKVKTKIGDKNIEDVEIGEDVLTHKNQYKKVTNTFQFNDKKTIMSINGIKCTPNHEFYVLHKKHRDYVNDDNIHEYAEWICAKNLTKEYLLLKI